MLSRNDEERAGRRGFLPARENRLEGQEQLRQVGSFSRACLRQQRLVQTADEPPRRHERKAARSLYSKCTPFPSTDADRGHAIQELLANRDRRPRLGLPASVYDDKLGALPQIQAGRPHYKWRYPIDANEMEPLHAAAMISKICNLFNSFLFFRNNGQAS